MIISFDELRIGLLNMLKNDLTQEEKELNIMPTNAPRKPPKERSAPPPPPPPPKRKETL